MLEFLKQRLQKVEKELMDLYEQRSNAGVGTIGEINNRISLLNQERKRLSDEITDIVPPIEPIIPSPKIIESKGEKSEIPTELIEEVKRLISNARICDAFKKIENVVDDNRIKTLNADYKSISNKNLIGVISSQEYRTAMNQITYGLLELLNDL